MVGIESYEGYEEGRKQVGIQTIGQENMPNMPNKHPSKQTTRRASLDQTGQEGSCRHIPRITEDDPD